MKSLFTPYEVLYRILSNRGFPLDVDGYSIIYDKLMAECDIILKQEDIEDDIKSVYHIEKKVKVMKKMIEKLQEKKVIFPNEYIEVRPMDNVEAFSLFGGV